MDSGANRDLRFLEDEVFDFDVSLSPVRSPSVSRNASPQLEEGGGDVDLNWTSLMDEALKVASQLQRGEPHVQEARVTSDGQTNSMTVKEEFIQDTDVKLGVLGPTTSALSPIKRQTFCVQDSPMKQLPPAIQRRLLRGSSSSRASSSYPAARRSTSSPTVGARPQPRSALRGKATLGAAAVLPSKPVPPTVSRSATKSGPERTRLQPLSRAAGVSKRSPSSRMVNRAESSEDLLSDSVSVASDTSDCSINSSLLGKRTLAPPSKKTGLRRLSGVKAPPVQSRKNASSSSSSLSSFNSSLSLSPAKGKLNSSLNQSLSSSVGRTPSSVRREPGPSRPRRSTVSASAELVSSSFGSRSQPTQAKRLPDGEHGKAVRSTPLKRAESTPVQSTLPKRAGERTVSVSTIGSARLQSGLKARSKTGGLVHPTANTADKEAQHVDGVSKVMKPKRLSVSGTDSSRPQKLAAGSLAPSAGSCKPQQVAALRPSGLPTPVKRRTSTFQTPSNQSRTFRPPLWTDSSITRTPNSAEKQRCSPVPKVKQEEEPVHYLDMQPFSLEEKLPIPLLSNNPGAGQTENAAPEPLMVSETIPTGNPIGLESAEETTAKTQEVLLLDLPPPTLQPREKLLIDLANTPDLIRTNSKSCTTTQLIDLSSPLIKWSPEERKENNAPLINLSF